MVLICNCLPCQYGDHQHHHEVVQAAPEGMLARCECKGECVERYRNRPIPQGIAEGWPKPPIRDEP